MARLAWAEAPALAAFGGLLLLGGEAWVYAIGLTASIAGLVLAAPTQASLRRDQERLDAAGTKLDLVEPGRRVVAAVAGVLGPAWGHHGSHGGTPSNAHSHNTPGARAGHPADRSCRRGGAPRGRPHGCGLATADAMAMALTDEAGPSWIIALRGIVIGDCGVFSLPADRGVVEIGYGLAEPFRGKGYATEAVGAMCQWLLVEAGATAIIGTAVEGGNIASRRVLEKLGFSRVDENGLHVSYRLAHD